MDIIIFGTLNISRWNFLLFTLIQKKQNYITYSTNCITKYFIKTLVLLKL
jgi:hypothetical protein